MRGGLGTLGEEFGLFWNDAVPLTTGAHNAFLSAFVAAGVKLGRIANVPFGGLKVAADIPEPKRDALTKSLFEKGIIIVGLVPGEWHFAVRK